MTSDAIIAAIPPTMMAALAWYSSIKNGRKQREVSHKVDVLTENTNGLTEKLISAKVIEAKAAGKIEERAEVAERKLEGQNTDRA